MGVSQPTASRIVAALEKKVGAALLTRTTRGVTLTEAGADYLVRAEAILAALDEADHAARGTGELRGVLRLAMSTTTAVRCVLPCLPRFVDQHPALRVEFVLNDERQYLMGLIGDGIDVSLRLGSLTDSSAVAKKIGVVSRVLAASPRYLAGAGTPRTPADLLAHSLIVGPAGRGPDGWTFQKDGKVFSAPIEGRFILNSVEGAIAATVAGLGIVSSGFFGMLRELQSGELVQVLPEWEMMPADFNAILPAGRTAKPSARAFTHFIADEVRQLEREWDRFRTHEASRAQSG